MPKPRFSLVTPAIYTDCDFFNRLARAGKLLSHAIKCASQAVGVGVRPIELAEIVERELTAFGAVPILKGFKSLGTKPFPAAAAVSVNTIAVNGVPSDEPLEIGDVLTIDSACELDGAVCDAAVSAVVCGGPDPLIDAARKVLDAACEVIVPGRSLNEIAEAARQSAIEQGCELLNEVIAHGTGLALHQPPVVFRDGARPNLLEIQPGMVLAIEPVVVEPGAGAPRTLADGWSRAASGRSAYEERTVLVVENGWIDLTPLAFGGR
ncbi:MAG: M24 family metallopeptidase [Phycisphaerales bacterium]|nr:M24 family metallopeptidase [Phycisphaerales bacterium]MCB9837261.1 M24 family metallopeptidase [Phycisphaera sp.]